MAIESFKELLEVLDTTNREWPAFLFRKMTSVEVIGSSGEVRRRRHDLQTVTFHELYRTVKTKSEELKQKSSQCVGVCASVSPEWVVDVFSAAIAGKRVVLFDHAMADDLENIVLQTGMDSLYTDYPRIRMQFENLMKNQNVIATRKKMLRDYLDDRLFPDPNAIEESGKLLFFTSGSTRKSKPVVLSQRALLRSAMSGKKMVDCTERDIVLSMLPLENVFGFVCSLLIPLTQGATVALSRGSRYYSEDPAFFRPSLMPVVPSLLKYLLKEHALNKELRTIVVGAGPCDMKDMEAVWRRGIDVRFGYGLTETAGGIALSGQGEDLFTMQVCPDAKIRIAEDGEIFVKTPAMMDGYFHDSEQTQKKLVNGELATGDIGYLDEQGGLHIRGRKDDVLVLSDGKNVHLTDWEDDLEKILRAKVALITVGGELELVVGASELRRTEIKELVDEYNDRAVDRQIVNVRLHPEPFPMTETGKLQRWKLGEECLEKIGTNGNAS